VKTSFRIFLGFALILSVGFVLLLSWIMNDVNVQPKKSMEESLVDMAYIIAASLEHNIHNNKVDTEPLRVFLESAGKRRFLARIYELEKNEVNIGVYVTNKEGIVLFDSNGGLFEGRDYSEKSDVYRTLQGRYGARTTRRKPGDPLSSVAYIGAPIKQDGEIIGVCTVSKAWTSINTFIETSRRKILQIAVVLFLSALALSFFISRWITRPIRRLTEYSDAVKEGKRMKMPQLGQGEIKELGDSFEGMLDSLEGREYIERYVQTLTHQLKGPLSAIRGAAELLQEDLPEPDRKRFINNVEIESIRLQRIVERMLELASLEQQRKLRNVETIDLSQLMIDITDEMTVTLKRKEIVLFLPLRQGYSFSGERFLIHQAIYNLLHNAVEFTAEGGTISVEIKQHWGRLFLIISDDGAGIPDYALDKVFDKFYSLQRPDTGKKSSGLGLSLVKEVAELHNGEVTIKPNSPKGTTAILKLPIGN
jgi:two-component system, OmpR family, sensor histidine kinase CreC